MMMMMVLVMAMMKCFSMGRTQQDLATFIQAQKRTYSMTLRQKRCDEFSVMAPHGINLLCISFFVDCHYCCAPETADVLLIVSQIKRNVTALLMAGEDGGHPYQCDTRCAGCSGGEVGTVASGPLSSSTVRPPAAVGGQRADNTRCWSESSWFGRNIVISVRNPCFCSAFSRLMNT